VPESVLTLLKFVFLALIYLFLWFIARVVLRELRAPALATATPGAAPPAAKKPAPAKAFATLRVIAPESRRGRP
jgi:hypothetical protein